jgi:hypothetical protein
MTRTCICCGGDLPPRKKERSKYGQYCSRVCINSNVASWVGYLFDASAKGIRLRACAEHIGIGYKSVRRWVMEVNIMLDGYDRKLAFRASPVPTERPAIVYSEGRSTAPAVKIKKQVDEIVPNFNTRPLNAEGYKMVKIAYKTYKQVRV